MAQAGFGVQMLEVERMERALALTPRLATRVFTKDEQAFCSAALRPAARYAGCFAARGAVYKALGLQPALGSSRWDVTLTFDDVGRPWVKLDGAALMAARAQDVDEVAISLSYGGDVAVANALAISKDARPKPKEEPEDMRAKLARSFREVRAVLDELERVQEDDGGTKDGLATEPASVREYAGADVPVAAGVAGSTAAQQPALSLDDTAPSVPAPGSVSYSGDVSTD